MKKLISTAAYIAISCSCIASPDTFKELKEGIDQSIENLGKEIAFDSSGSNEQLFPQLKKKLVFILGPAIEAETGFQVERVLEDTIKALFYAINDTCIQPGSGTTPMSERLTALQRSLVMYSASLHDFIKKIDQSSLSNEQKYELHIDYLRALAKQALMLRTTIGSLIPNNQEAKL